MDLHKKFIIAIAIFLILLLGGTFVYSCVEGWNFIDSLYFIIVTVTTIGYGDLFPQTNTGKIFTMFFSFFGIGMALYFFTLFGKYISQKTFKYELKEHHKKLIKHIESRILKKDKIKKRK
jgi:uncharacterized protein YneF (UPF0154 family)